MGKGNSSNVNETQGFQTLRHSNGTIYSLLNIFCAKKFPASYPASHDKPFLYYGKEAAREKKLKKETPQKTMILGEFKLEHLLL